MDSISAAGPSDASANQPLDALIVGGGPAGTAAAFRAKELGLRALVIDFDDILKRIRDYPKDKPILPDFGGGDLSFPDGDDCVRALRFPPIDKDELHGRWKGFYGEFDVPFRLGLELVSMERGDGVWTVQAHDHKQGERVDLQARHVVLAPGRGVPRRFDIPGDTAGIAYRLDDPARYVEGPAIVVGGGTSAAEAVIAISGAKAQAENPCAVFWSYRGTKMPRVSMALAERFFEAYVGNGNIRYLPESEPVAVVTNPDRSERISFRIDRKTPEHRPSETLHLEFEKGRCIACIGADLPVALLRDIGIEMVSSGGPKEKKMIAVTQLLESRQDDVYLIGDLLSQAYLETDDFEAPPEAHRPVKHRGNIKTSLRDGVFVAEVIKQRLDGRSRSEVEVFIGDAGEAEEVGRDARVTVITGLTGEAGPSSTESPADEEASTGRGRLVQVTEAGVEAEEYELKPEGATGLGRGACDISFPNDTALSESHASISNRDGDFYLRDDGSRSGTYLRVSPERPLTVGDGDLIRLGRQILVVKGKGGEASVDHYGADGRKIGSYPIGKAVVFGRSGGRSNPDVLLDNDDMTLSRFHMALSREDGELRLEDFNSRNGTYLKVDTERRLENGDRIRIGSQQLEFRTRDEAPTKTGSRPVPELPREEDPAASTPVAAEPTPPPAHEDAGEAHAGAESAPAAEGPAAGAEAPATTEPHVRFADQDIAGAIDPADSLLEWADEHDVSIDYECWAGLCGCDVIKVVEGSEHLNEVQPKELKTLERKGLEPGVYRLACMTKVSGPVVVEAAD